MSVEWIGPAWLRRPAEALGVRYLHRATRLSLNGPIYTDAAVEHLHQLTDLRELTLTGTQISAPALARLRKSLPACRIEDISRQKPNPTAS